MEVGSRYNAVFLLCYASDPSFMVRLVVSRVHINDVHRASTGTLEVFQSCQHPGILLGTGSVKSWLLHTSWKVRTVDLLLLA